MITHKKDLENIINAKKQGGLNHAYLISGSEGMGKLDFAFMIAKVSICESGHACGSCEACQSIQKMSNPDLHYIKEGGSIKIEQIRDLKKILELKPYGYDKKIVIIPNIERITTEAANSLLKTLEEPSGSAIIILTAESAMNVLPTIKSRCQEIKLSPIDVKSLQEILENEYDILPEEVENIARLSGGKIRMAREMVENKTHEESLLFLKEIIETSFAGRFKKVQELAERDIMTVLNQWEVSFRDLLLLKTGNNDLVSRRDLTFFPKYKVEEIVNILDNLKKTKEYVGGKLNNKLILESFVLNI